MPQEMASKAGAHALYIIAYVSEGPGYWVKIHHLEYTDGGILDPDDVLADVVEDKDKANVFSKTELQLCQRDLAFKDPDYSVQIQFNFSWTLQTALEV
ncbi:hypothetical protein P7K49_013765 [Saguinus oedipus]|uniref:Par3/HAL N-terminal domain-containing protein n=1 Tax=Saguinus oedipus TaxID=9490 RepID=A0ABQ9VHM1_SAGOE|nr:hypothetical protein P7K49_013765 [Saguinus oedipus]